jgi:hypothetical protein
LWPFAHGRLTPRCRQSGRKAVEPNDFRKEIKALFKRQNASLSKDATLITVVAASQADSASLGNFQ